MQIESQEINRTFENTFNFCKAGYYAKLYIKTSWLKLQLVFTSTFSPILVHSQHF